VSHKSPRIAALLADLDSDAPNTEGLPRHYLGFFRCFNHGLYFEAHDVLEELWLADGKTGANYAFYKGLIQWAGAFVHLQKGRLRPAVALFNLATANLKQYPTIHLRLDLLNALEDMRSWRQDIEASAFQTNPLTQRPTPHITLLPPQSPIKASDAVISTVPQH
jgi:hypothetical protein